MRSFLLVIVLSLFVLFSASPAIADGVSVEYTAINLGSGTWQYDYTLQGSFSANQGVAIYFLDPSYGAITDLVTGGSDWSTFAFQADPSILAPGEYDILALVDNPSLTSSFDVTFQWDGSGAPGAQAFDLFDFSNGGAVLLQSGNTTAVPEATPLLLMLFAGLAYLTVLMIRRLI